MNKIFKVIIITCILIFVLSVSGSFIYYYVFFRPGIEKAEIRLQEQKIAEEALRKENLEKCLKETEDWFNELILLEGTMTNESVEFFWNMKQDKANECYMKYGK